jgi:AcrR family transcriptional regulator
MAIAEVGGTSPKALQILDGARSAFMELGFEGTSVDDIARRAGVSKATVYKHFADKQALFVAVVRSECARHVELTFTIRLHEDDTYGGLLEIAEQFVDLVLSPFAQRMVRMVVAETARFPEIGRAFYEATAAVGSRRVANYLAAGVARGALAIDDLELAAYQFLELCKADLHWKRICGVIPDPSPEDRRRAAKAAVDAFWKIYGTAPQPRA